MQNKFRENKQYNPAEDTFFLADFIKNEKGDTALDIGSGSGYLTKLLTESFSFVVGTDINFQVIKKQSYKTSNLVCCSGADALSLKFDLIICNLPYLATDEIIDIATDGGPEGLVIPAKILHSARKCVKPGGKMLYVTSSLSNYTKLIEITENLGFETSIIGKKKLFFEELIIIEAKKLLS